MYWIHRWKDFQKQLSLIHISEKRRRLQSLRWWVGKSVSLQSILKANYTQRPRKQGEKHRLRSVSYTHLDVYKRQILQECYKYRLIDPSEVFVDATHVKARANSKKMRKRIADEDFFYILPVKIPTNKLVQILFTIVRFMQDRVILQPVVSVPL